MKTKFLLMCGIICFAGITFQSCSDDDDVPVNRIDPDYHSIFFGAEKSDTYDLGNYVTIRSNQSPQGKEHNRTSDNFSTVTLSGGEHGTPQYVVVSCPDNIKFRVCQDVKNAADKEIYKDVYNGAILEYYNSDKLYIANPDKASSSFDVKFTAFYPKPGYAFASCPGRTLEGEDHRGSLDFVLPTDYARYKVHCNEKSATFSIYESKTAASDNKIATNVKDGDIVNMSPSKRNYYIHSPSSDGKRFQVLFEPLTVEWMTALDGSKSIADISIPGTHDTGTYKLEPVNLGFSKCQNMDINQQLEFGIRYFDLRVTDDMNIEHGGIPCYVSFDNITQTACTFLKNHPKEALIFEITGDNFHSKFKDYRDSHPDVAPYFWLGDTVPKLDEVRGKIMIVRRYDSSSNSEGLDFFTKGVWPDNGSLSSTNPDGVVYYIEDKFFEFGAEPKHDTEKKTELLNQAIDHKLANSGTLCIAFSSVSANANHTPYDYMWGGGTGKVDPLMSKSISDKIDSLKDDAKCVGIIVMDYYNADGHNDNTHVVEKIINTNFAKDKKPFDIGRLHSSYD